jgi:hypothetical protein
VLKDVALAATVGAEAAFTVAAGASMVAAGSTVGAAGSTVGAAFAVAAFVVPVAFTAMAPGASAEVMAVFAEASAAPAEATAGMVGVGVEVGVEVGVGVDSVGPTSDLDSIPGPIGPDRTLATTTILIIPTTDAIPTGPILAIRMDTGHTAATRIPIARTQVILPIHPRRLLTL